MLTKVNKEHLVSCLQKMLLNKTRRNFTFRFQKIKQYIYQS